MKISELQKEAYETAKSKGWHETERTPLEYHALIYREIGEATEEVRDGSPPIYQFQEHVHEDEAGCENTRLLKITPDFIEAWDKTLKPEGELIELADAVIRIADYCGSRGWDLEEAIKIKLSFNKARPWMHGGKKI